METETLSRSLRFEAASRLRTLENRNARKNIRECALWVKQNPEELNARVEEFEKTIHAMNSLWLQKDLDPNLFGNFIEFKTTVGGESPPDLKEIVDRYHARETGDPIIDFVPNTFARIRGKIDSGEWKFPVNLSGNPQKLTSALLIEGLGLLVEEFYGQEEIARSFVLAFEETLIMFLPDSKLLADVIDWMREESADFSPGIRQILRGKI